MILNYKVMMKVAYSLEKNVTTLGTKKLLESLFMKNNIFSHYYVCM